MKTYWALVWLVLAGTVCRGEWSPSAAALSDARRAAIRDAIRFAEPKEVVQNAFAELAIAPAGTGQQDLLKSKLRTDNLSMFCMTGPLNPEIAAAKNAGKRIAATVIFRFISNLPIKSPAFVNYNHSSISST